MSRERSSVENPNAEDLSRTNSSLHPISQVEKEWGDHMTSEEMFMVVIGRMDTLESSLNNRVDALENRIDIFEENVNLEIQAVRTEMEVVNKSLKQDIAVLNNKADRLMVSKDVEGFDQLKIRVDVLEKGYQDLREKIC